MKTFKEMKGKLGNEGTHPQGKPLSSGKGPEKPLPGKKPKSTPGPKSTPSPKTYPAKENEREPGVKPKNLPHDPIKGASRTKHK